ncbi:MULTISPECIES: hypothetical protein, partial [unclassified Bradyrhizobium]|uniref:hypothetical protein n=1 Tax=unclassified Bradyrhizobium TaxID=2631580 RepID=UPI0028ED5348
GATFASLLENASINRCSRYLNAYGECRVKASPMARLQQRKQAAVTTGSAGSSGIPCATVLTAASRSPRCAGLFGHRRPREAKPRRELDTSVGVSGPRDLTVRIDAVRRRDEPAAASTRPPHPALNVRDDRDTSPHIEAGWSEAYTISEKAKDQNSEI